MTRSDKEIREKDFVDFMVEESDAFRGESYSTLDTEALTKWLLEGEPRYSVEELEKIISYCAKQYEIATYKDLKSDKFFKQLNEYASAEWWFENPLEILITLLGNPVKVKEILEKD